MMHTLNLYLPGLKVPVSYRIPMDDAIEPVTLHRREVDAYNGKPGYSVECMNAQCGLREQKAFPHRVYLIEFTDSRAFVVDKIDRRGAPAHCFRYYHHEGDEQKLFDQPGGKTQMLRSGKVIKTFRLLPPTDTVKHIPNPNPKKIRHIIAHRAFAPRMSFARALRGGLVADNLRTATGE